MIRTSRRILAALIAMLALTALSATSAQAAPFTISVDNAILDLGAVRGVRAIDSELSPPDPPATLTGDLSGASVNVPKAGFVFPTKNTVASGIPITINMEANDDITGTFDAGTGKLVLDANLKATVDIPGSSCVISPIELTLSSENARPYLGQAFTGGIEGEGVVSARWAVLPKVTGAGCGLVGQLIGGAGGIAMSHGVHNFKTCATDPSNPLCSIVTAPEKEPVLDSTPSYSTDQTTATFTFAKGNGETQPVDGFECTLDNGTPEPCNSGSKEYTTLALGEHSFQVKATNSVGKGPTATYNWTITKPAAVCPPGTIGTPPNCVGRKARLANLKVAPKTKTVKRGKKTVVKVTVKNVGDAVAAGAKVCVKAPKKLVKVKKCVNLRSVAAGKAKTAKFKVTVSKKARKGKRAVLKFKATANKTAARSGKATIRVK